MTVVRGSRKIQIPNVDEEISSACKQNASGRMLLLLEKLDFLNW